MWHPPEIIISMPRSGTRSLKKHLGHDGYWHFGSNDADIRLFSGVAHVPIRDPFDVAMSWEVKSERAQPPEYKQSSIDEMLRRFDLQIEYVSGACNCNELIVWLADELPEHEGEGRKHWVRDKRNRGKAAKLDRSVALRNWYAQNEKAQTFYAKHFPKGFWWA